MDSGVPGCSATGNNLPTTAIGFPGYSPASVSRTSEATTFSGVVLAAVQIEFAGRVSGVSAG